ncbi:MAG: FMN-binding protein [Acetatifactor sp.]
MDAISGATITTRAITNAVNGGLRVAKELMQGGGANE